MSLEDVINDLQEQIDHNHEDIKILYQLQCQIFEVLKKMEKEIKKKK